MSLLGRLVHHKPDRRPKPRRKAGAPFAFRAATEGPAAQPEGWNFYYPGPPPHKVFCIWTAPLDDDGTLTLVDAYFGAVELDEVLRRIDRSPTSYMGPDDAPRGNDLIVTESGCTVARVNRYVDREGTIERLDLD